MNMYFAFQRILKIEYKKNISTQNIIYCYLSKIIMARFMYYYIYTVITPTRVYNITLHPIVVYSKCGVDYYTSIRPNT